MSGDGERKYGGLVGGVLYPTLGCAGGGCDIAVDEAEATFGIGGAFAVGAGFDVAALAVDALVVAALAVAGALAPAFAAEAAFASVVFEAPLGFGPISPEYW